MKLTLKDNPKVICMFVFNNFTHDSRVLKEASTLVEIGYQVHIIALWKKGLARLEKQNNILIHRLDNVPIHIRLLGQKNLERLKKLVYKQPRSNYGGEKKTNPGAYQKTKLNILKFLIIIVKKILFYSNFYQKADKYLSKKGIKADVYHSHDLNTLFIGQKLAHKHNAKLVYDSHELYVYHYRPYILPRFFYKKEEGFERKYIKKADAVITVSNSIVGYLKNIYAIDKPHLIMNAPKKNKNPGDSKYSLRKELNLNDNQKLLLYSGGITFSRGLDRVIESLASLDDLFFVMMGPGKEEFKNYLKAVAVKHGVSHRVSFFGPVPSKEVSAYAASADVGITSTENLCINNYYCAPNKLFEYIQGGLPVVASNFPDLKNIVEKNDIGITCDISDPQEIAKAVNKVFNKYHTYLNNVKKIQNTYCWENEELKLTKLYIDLFRKI
jgi:glycosyltransferase involved in cell wall biosynthesis